MANAKSALTMGAIFLGLTLCAAFGQSNRLVIDNDEYNYTATLNSDRISAGELRELLFFSPYEFGTEGWEVAHQKINAARQETSGRIEKIAIAIPLELCIDNEARYKPCGSRDISDPNFMSNAEVNIGLNEQAMVALDHFRAPAELTSVLQQFRDSLAFFSTVEQRRLEYLRTGNLGVLSTRIGAINPSVECVAEMKQLENVATISQSYKLSLYGWQNCLNSAWHRVSPQYPRQAWRSFLQAYGITEHFTEKAVD
jgi:hypothetical protein